MKSRHRMAILVAAFAVLLAGATQAGEIKGKVSVQGLKSAENIAVYVDTIPGKVFPAPRQHAIVDQKQMKFVPHVAVVQKGTTVEFLNSDTVAHNVYWPSISGNKALRHNLTIISPHEKKSFQFDDLGVAELLCNLHPEMIGYVVIVPTPYFAITDKDGSFEIHDIAPGTYTLKTWSEEGKPTTQTINVAAGTANVELTVTK